MSYTFLFFPEDKIVKLPGLYLLWTCIYISNLVVLFSDGTEDESRTFNMIANGLSVIYTGAAGLNTVYGNKIPSSLFVSAGPIHQYLYWMLFAFYKPTNILGRHPIGVMNWVTTIVVGLFTIDMIVKTWLVTLYPDTYLNYVSDSKKTVTSVGTEVSSSSGVEEQKGEHDL